MRVWLHVSLASYSDCNCCVILTACTHSDLSGRKWFKGAISNYMIGDDKMIHILVSMKLELYSAGAHVLNGRHRIIMGNILAYLLSATQNAAHQSFPWNLIYKTNFPKRWIFPWPYLLKYICCMNRYARTIIIFITMNIGWFEFKTF